MNSSKITTDPLKWLILLFFLAIFSPLKAQQTYALSADDQQLAVFGTSTLHDWEMTTSSAVGAGTFQIENGKLVWVKDLTISFDAESLKSGKRGMDKKAYTALKTSDHKSVIFRLKEYQPKANGEGEVKGQLEVAGESREVALTVEEQVTSQGLNVKGSAAFKLTDFKIDPPRALAGTIRTGDEVTIEFNVIFKLK